MSLIKSNTKSDISKEEELAKKFISRKHLGSIFREKGLKVSGSNNNEVLNAISEYIIDELRTYIKELNQTTEKHLKKIITLNIAEDHFNLKYEEIESQSMPSRLFSSRFISKLVHNHEKRISGVEPVLDLIKKLLYRRILHLAEKTKQACLVSKRVIITKEVVDLALEMAESH